MKEWIFSIIFIVLITSVIGLILPEGRLGKLLKGIFSIVILMIIIKPITSLDFATNNFDFPSVNIDEELQYDFIDFVNKQKIDSLKNECLEILKKNSIAQALIEIDYSTDVNNNISINFVKIFLGDKVINQDSVHIVVKEELSKTIANYLSINSNKVIFYE